jgi:hypothetical protein
LRRRSKTAERGSKPPSRACGDVRSDMDDTLPLVSPGRLGSGAIDRDHPGS